MPVTVRRSSFFSVLDVVAMFYWELIYLGFCILIGCPRQIDFFYFILMHKYQQSARLLNTKEKEKKKDRSGLYRERDN